MLEPIRPRESTVDACSNALKRHIFRGELVPGQRLPAERRLAETFGVNRVTVRSALDRLTTAGLLSRRQGSGYRVLDYRRTGGPELLGEIATVALEDGTLLDLVSDLLRMRRSLARTLFEALSARLDDDGLAGIAAAVESFAEVADDDDATLAALVAADLDVLMSLLDASKSLVLPLCFNPVIRTLRDLPTLTAAMYAQPQDNLTAYRLLVALLEAPPTDLADRVLSLIAARDRVVLERLSESLQEPATP